jgi:acetylornithine deacetylase/succinyl-diaminopimelate desuccinylase-like protein
MIPQSRIVELVKTLVAIPSVTGHEQALSDWIFDFFTSLGLQGVQRLPVDEAGDTVVGWIEGSGEGKTDAPTLLYTFHLDTFDVFDGWKTDPFEAVHVGDRLYGLGTHDMKGGAACVLAAVEALVKSGIQLGGRLMIAATTDEENWSRGAHALIESGLLEGCVGCLIPEPSDVGTLTVGARGRHVYHLEFQGRTVHSGYDSGVSALVDAARVVASLSEPGAVDLGFNETFNIAGSQCVIGFESGGQLVLVPERANVYVDRFTLPGETAELVAEQICQVVDATGILGEYTLTWDERPTLAPAPYVVPIESWLVQSVSAHLAAEQQCEIRYVLARSVADTNHLAVHGGVPTLICGPQGGNTCEANEYVEINSLAAIAQTYVNVALDLLA